MWNDVERKLKMIYKSKMARDKKISIFLSFVSLLFVCDVRTAEAKENPATMTLIYFHRHGSRSIDNIVTRVT